MRLRYGFAVFALALSIHARAQSTPVVRAELSGSVRDSAGSPVPGARIRLLGTPYLSLTNDVGQYRFTGVPAGRYLIQATRLGFAPSEPDTVTLVTPERATRDIVLTAVQIPLSRVLISPGSFSLLDEQASSAQVLTREQFLTAPQLAEDIFRSLTRLPGFSGSDYTSKFRIRNGLPDEQLVTLDGLELIEPFHLKDLDGALAMVDADAIGRVELVTGGFGANWGNHTTGMLHLQSAQPSPARARTSFGLSFSNARARSEGTFARGRGSWMASVRRGYIDLLLKILGEKDAPDPTYYDGFAKVQYQLGSRHLLSLHTLYAGDKLNFAEDDGETRILSSYRTLYWWASWRAQLTERLTVTTLASTSGLDWGRRARAVDRLLSRYYESEAIRDRRRLDINGLKQDWTWDASPRVSVLAGGELRDERADYSYVRRSRDYAVLNNTVVVFDSSAINAARTPNGSRVSGYASLRVKPASWMTTELGVRSDRLGWTNETTVVPRFNLALTPIARTTLRAAWGTYAQGHSLDGLSIIDGDTTFSRAERAEQRIVGVERDLGNGWTVRTEAYERVIRNPRPRWLNADGDIDLLPEAAEDRLRIAPSAGSVRGVEILATLDRGGPYRLTTFYSLARGRQTVNGVASPRPFDERHSASLDVAYRARRGWTWAAAWTFHSGWPLSPATASLDTIAPNRVVVVRDPPSPLLTERLPSYQRFDVRVTKDFSLGRGQGSVYLEIFNLFDAANARGYDYGFGIANGQPFVQRTDTLSFLPRLPSIGVRWAF